jgi:hypothetical protein
MDFAEQKRKPKQTVAPTYYSVSAEGSKETPLPPGNGVDYSTAYKSTQNRPKFGDIPARLQQNVSTSSGSDSAQIPISGRSQYPPTTPGNGVDYSTAYKSIQERTKFGDIPAHLQKKAQGQPKDSSAPMQIAQFADSGIDDGFWFKALAAVGLAIYKGGEYIVTGSEKAVEDLYRNLMKARQGSGKEKDKQPSDAQPLPRDKNGMPIPDSEYPHTQLGTKKGSKGTYRQTREWGTNGQLKKDTDWTDHGRPSNHPNPHDHEWIPNSTGGSLQRGPAKPFPKN